MQTGLPHRCGAVLGLYWVGSRWNGGSLCEKEDLGIGEAVESILLMPPINNLCLLLPVVTTVVNFTAKYFKKTPGL